MRDDNKTNEWTTGMVEAYLSKVMDERDNQYRQRWEAQESAVANAFNAQEKAVASALSAAERAVSKAEMASEKRFDTINEKIESNNMILDKFESNTKSLVGRIDDLREYKDTTSGRSTGQSVAWAQIIAAVSFAGAILYLLVTLKH
jgi:Fe2+ transport system protein B